MKIKSVKLCGQKMSIEYSNPSDWNSSAMGRMLPIEGKIVLNVKSPKTIQQSILMHEILHFIADTQDISELQLDNEIAISVLSNSLLAFIKDNKKIIEYLTRE